jgi:hypothetical protein
MITTKGRRRLDALSEPERQRFERGELVVQEPGHAGGNLCAAFHPERYVREILGERLDVLDFVPATAKSEQSQDVTLFRTPSQ